LFETTDFCFSLFNNPEIEALKPEPGDQRTPGQTRRVDNRAVEVAFKKSRFFRFFKNLKKPKSPNFGFFRFFVSKNSNSLLNHVLKVQKLELNN